MKINDIIKMCRNAPDWYSDKRNIISINFRPMGLDCAFVSSGITFQSHGFLIYGDGYEQTVQKQMEQRTGRILSWP